MSVLDTFKREAFESLVRAVSVPQSHQMINAHIRQYLSQIGAYGLDPCEGAQSIIDTHADQILVGDCE